MASTSVGGRPKNMADCRIENLVDLTDEDNVEAEEPPQEIATAKKRKHNDGAVFVTGEETEEIELLTGNTCHATSLPSLIVFEHSLNCTIEDLDDIFVEVEAIDPVSKSKAATPGKAVGGWEGGIGYGGTAGTVSLNKIAKVTQAQSRQVAQDSLIVKVVRELSQVLSQVAAALTNSSLVTSQFRQHASALMKKITACLGLRIMLSQYLCNDSLTDIADRSDVYCVIFGLISQFSKLPEVRDFLKTSLLDDKSTSVEPSPPASAASASTSSSVTKRSSRSSSSSSAVEVVEVVEVVEAASDSVAGLISSMHEQAHTFARLHPSGATVGDSNYDVNTMNALGIALHIESVYKNLASFYPSSDDEATADAATDSTDVAVVEKQYVAVLRKQRLEAIPLLEHMKNRLTTHVFVNAYASSGDPTAAVNAYLASVTSSTSTGRSGALKLSKEVATLVTSLPVELGSSIFIRCDEDNLNVMKALIIGPEGTPYENGCFEFDILIPTTYPQVPPKVQLITTGGGSVRFNPNLYNCGKVCLSLLGTWAGPGWDSNSSSLLQVLVSIQSLILVPDPFFNEPSYETTRGTPTGDARSKAYNQVIVEGTLKYAILGQLEKPSPMFEGVIKDHFRLKRGLVCQQMDKWAALSGQSRTLATKIKTVLKKL